MIDLYRFGTNPFSDEDISSEDLGTYGTEHLARMTEDPAGGQLNAEIAATATALDLFDVALTSETVKLGVQKARTAAKEEFRTLLANAISKLYGAVIMKFGQSSAQVTEFFPEGREVFSDCVDSVLETKLKATRTALVDKETASPGFFLPETLTLAGTLVTTWEGLYGAAAAGRSGRAQTATERRAHGQALRTQFFKNLLRISTIYAGQSTMDGRPLGEERIAHYCPQHLLESAPTGNPPVG